MFIPKERIRHGAPRDEAPTETEARTSRLFSSYAFPRGMTVSSRAWVPAMVPWRATASGEVTEDVLDWYGRFADGEPGVLVIEATGIREVSSGPLLRIGDDRFIDGLSRVAEVVHQRSGGRTKILIQLIDFLKVRRRPPRERFFLQFLALTADHRRRFELVTGAPSAADEGAFRAALAALSDLALTGILTPRETEALEVGERERVTDLENPAILELPERLPTLFFEAARRARAAGFDGVELHYAHAYTMASFLSRTNTRTDGYGGSLEGRLRLPLEVIDAVKPLASKDFLVGARILCDEIIDGGTPLAEAARIGVALAAAGLDFLSLSTGGKFDDAKAPKVGEAVYPYTGRSGFECMPPILSDAVGPYGRNVHKQRAVREALRAAGLETPTVAAGGINTFSLAEAVLREESADFIGAARQSLADPTWWKKLREGRGGAVHRCTLSNYCEGLDQKHRAVTCRLWDRLELESGPTTDRGRRRLIAPSSW